MTETPHNPNIDIREAATRPAPASGRPTVAKAAAIQYDRGGDQAPQVTASGRGAVAEQILAIAFERGVKVREDAELAEILSLLEVDSPIPVEAFAAVAEILAYVYRINDAQKARPS